MCINISTTDCMTNQTLIVQQMTKKCVICIGKVNTFSDEHLLGFLKIEIQFLHTKFKYI